MIDFALYTKENIQEEMLGQVDNSFDKRTGSVIQSGIGPVAWYLEGVYMLLSQIQQNAYATTAVGEYLDNIVPERGISRNKATAAEREGMFNISLPEGALFKTINGNKSVVFTVGSFLKQEEYYVYSLICKEEGVIGNSYTGNLLPVTAIPNLTHATIGKIIKAGTDEEQDEALRSRYFATFNTPAFGGNISAYKNKILAISGVGAVQIYPTWKGGGTTLCSILGSDLKPAHPSVVENVQNIICPIVEGENSPSPNGIGFAPIGAEVSISTGTALPLDISCNIQFVSTLQNGVEVHQSTIEQKIQEYINEINSEWDKELVGHTISYPVTVYVSRVIFAIMSISDVVNVSNLLINGQNSDISLIETAELQQVPVLGVVTVNG